MSEIAAITQGMQSVQGTGMYTARLDAFTKNAKAFEAYDFNKGLESEAAKKQKDAATFTEVALGFNVTPDSNKMYVKHHALLSKKFETLFSDDNLTAMAATPEGRARFSRAVEQLNQEAKGYESIYSSTFGDPSTADGKGFTYSDYKKRKSSGGNKDFFRGSGFDISRSDEDYENQIQLLDNSADIGTISFDPATGTWSGYKADDPLLSMDMKIASQYFSYDLRQTSFNSPSYYAQDKPLYEMFKGQNEAAVRQNLVSRRSMMQMEAVAYYQSTLPDGDVKKELTPQQYRDDLVNSKTLEQAHEEFENSIVEGLKERQRKDEEDTKEKKSARGGSSGGGGGSYISYSVVGDSANLSIPLTTSSLGTVQEGSFQYAKLVNGELIIVLKLNDENKEHPAENYSSVLNKKFGPNAIAKMKASLGGQVQSVNASDY